MTGPLVLARIARAMGITDQLGEQVEVATLNFIIPVITFVSNQLRELTTMYEQLIILFVLLTDPS